MSPPDDGQRPVPLAEVARMLAEAEVIEPQAPPPLADPPPPPPEEPPPPEDDGGGGDDGGGQAWSKHLPPDCPVIPLGTELDTYFYQDSLGQLRALKAKDHSRLNLQSLFGEDAEEYLRTHWASLKALKRELADGTKEEVFIVTGWKAELVAGALMSEGAAQGVWSPQHRVRGAGAWRGDEGELILHLGDKLLIRHLDGRIDECKPGRIGTYLYPTDGKLLRPADKAQGIGRKGPAETLMRLYLQWPLRNGETDAYLLVGLAVAAMLGGALKRRPVHWTRGDFGTGKSSLQDAQRWLHGPGGALQTPDGTAAGVRQIVRHRSTPVWIDEAEPKAQDNNRITALVELARSAYTGSLAVRGGNDHNGSTFNLYSVVGFSSILIPSMEPADLSRMLIIDVDPLPPDAKMPAFDEAIMARLGAKLLRRAIDQWHRLPGVTASYRQAMASAGYSPRAQDVYGTLLACAHIAFQDDEPNAEADLTPWMERLPREIEIDTDAQSCLQYLMTYIVDDPHDRSRRSVAQWVERAASLSGEYFGNEQTAAQEVLGTIGLRFTPAHGDQPYLAVANKHDGLNRVFRGTHWHSRATSSGVWVQSLERLPGACKPERGPDKKPKKMRIGGFSLRCQLLPVPLCLGQDGDSQPDANNLPPAGAPTPRPRTNDGQPAGGPASPRPPQRLDDPGWPAGPDPSDPDPWPDDGSYPYPDP